MTRMHFTNDPECVAACRDFVERALRPRSVELVDRAVLVTSELVTNAIRHTRQGGSLEVVIGPELLRLEVSDYSHSEPRQLPHGESAMHGRGLPIVSTLASDWGVHESGAGKTIWATFDLE